MQQDNKVISVEPARGNDKVIRHSQSYRDRGSADYSILTGEEHELTRLFTTYL
jgi:hypothetical protein